MTPDIHSPEPKKRSLLKRLGFIVAGILLLMVVAYFVVTSSGFVKAVILPRVGATMNATITADEVSLSPFSRLAVKGLRVKTTGAEVLLTSQEARLRYKLMPTLKGIITVDELYMASPVLQIVQRSDGSSNLDPVLDALLDEESTEPLLMAVRNVQVQKGRILWSSQSSNGVQRSVDLENLDVSIDRLENGQPGKVTLVSDVFYKESLPASSNLPPSSLQIKLNGAYDYALTQDLLPQALNGSARYQITEGRGGLQDTTGLNGVFESQITPAEIQQLAIRFERGGNTLGQIRASGPFDASRMEGRIRIDVSSIDRQVLNLLGASRKWDFGKSVINSTNLIALSQAGKLIVASGSLEGNQIGLRAGNQATPETNLRGQYEVSVDMNKQSALLQQLQLRALEGERPVLEVQLEQPMSFSWGTTQAGFKDSALNFAINRFDLKPWQAMFGPLLPAGVVDLQGRLNSQKDGQVLNTEAKGRITGLDAQWQTNRIQLQEINLSMNAVAEAMKRFTLNSFRVNLVNQDQPLAGVEGSGVYDKESQNYRFLANLDASLPGLLRLYSVSNMQVRAGRLRYNSIAEGQKDKQTFSGSFSLGELSGRYNDYFFQNYGAGIDYSAEMRGSELRLQRATFKATQGFDQGGTADLSGTINLDTQATQLKFSTVDLNQNALGPFLTPMLAPRRLTSVTLTSTGQVAYVNGRPDLQADLKVSNLAMQDANKKSLAPPLDVRVIVDAGMKTTNQLEFRKTTLALAPTPLARNQIDMTGLLDFSKTNATSGQLTVQADSLDLTPIYAIYNAPQGATSSAAKPEAGAPAASAPAPANTEPPPMQLPVGKLDLQMRVGALYVGEMVLTNWQTSLRIETNQVVIPPFNFALNGRTVKGSASLDLSQPGYGYNVSMQLDGVPVEPLARTFLTPEVRDYYHGELYANGQIQGAGSTGTSLKKTLSGQFSLLYTNANMALLSPRSQMIVTPVAQLLRVPELSKTPLDTIETRGRMGNGVIEIQRFAAVSGAFQAESKGQIIIADVLTNSTLDLPVAISLNRPIAEKANLVPANTPTNLAYVPLPPFAKVAGTLGVPETKMDKSVLAGLLLRSVSGLPSALAGGTGDKVGDVMQGLGNLLSGNRSTNTAAGTATNPQPAKFTLPTLTNLLNQLPIGTNRAGSAPTNTAATTNAPAPNPFDLLRGVLKKDNRSLITTNQATNSAPKPNLP